MISIKKATVEDIQLISNLAGRIWPLVYGSLLHKDQIAYMLAQVYSHDALKDQMIKLNHEFIIIRDDENALGYASFSRKSPETPGIYRLHKLYMMPDQHGKGLGRKMISFVSSEIRPRGATALELNVHKKNPSVGFYRKMGFITEREELIEFGGGYYLDDFVMTLHYQ